jgi:hypothetical protein
MRVVKNGTQFAKVGEPVRFAVLSAIPEEIVSVCFSMESTGIGYSFTGCTLSLRSWVAN